MCGVEIDAACHRHSHREMTKWKEVIKFRLRIKLGHDSHRFRIVHFNFFFLFCRMTFIRFYADAIRIYFSPSSARQRVNGPGKRSHIELDWSPTNRNGNEQKKKFNYFVDTRKFAIRRSNLASLNEKPLEYHEIPKAQFKYSHRVLMRFCGFPHFIFSPRYLVRILFSSLPFFSL